MTPTKINLNSKHVRDSFHMKYIFLHPAQVNPIFTSVFLSINANIRRTGNRPQAETTSFFCVCVCPGVTDRSVPVSPQITPSSLRHNNLSKMRACFLFKYVGEYKYMVFVLLDPRPPPLPESISLLLPLINSQILILL